MERHLAGVPAADIVCYSRFKGRAKQPQLRARTPTANDSLAQAGRLSQVVYFLFDFTGAILPTVRSRNIALCECSRKQGGLDEKQGKS